MYDLIDVVAAAEAAAAGAVLQDRERYAKFMELAERFAAENDLVVCGAAATRLLLGNPADPAEPAPVDLDSFQIDLCCGSALARARALGDAAYQLDPQGLGHYTAVLTKIPEHQFAVAVDGRELCTLTALPIHRGVRTADVVLPETCSAQFARADDGTPLQLECLGADAQLVSVYAALCDPGSADGWPALLAAEATLRAHFVRTATEQIAFVVGQLRGLAAAGAPQPRGQAVGGALPATGATGPAEGLDSRPPALVEGLGGPALAFAARAAGAGLAPRRLHRAIIDRYASGPGRVLVGDGAIGLMDGRDPAAAGRLQVVSAAPLGADAKEIVGIVEGFGHEAQWAINDPKLPTDPRMRRLTVYRVAGGKREALVDVFGAAAYELVPFVRASSLRERLRSRLGGRRDGRRPRRGADAGGRRHPDGRGRHLDGRAPANPGDAEVWEPKATLRIGTPFVLMRFRLIDLWTVRLLMHMGSVAPDYGRAAMGEIFRSYEAAAALYVRTLAEAAADPEAAGARLLPREAYIGRREEAALALRREAQRAGRFYPPYLPAARKG